MGSRIPSEAEVFKGLLALLGREAILAPWRTVSCRIDRSGLQPIYWILATRKATPLVAEALTRFLAREFPPAPGIWLLPVVDARRIARLAEAGMPATGVSPPLEGASDPPRRAARRSPKRR